MLAPRDESDIAEILAAGSGALEPVGGGSRRTVGRPVAAEMLDLSALTGILDYEPGELTVTARAATPLEEIEQVLGAQAQRLAFEPPDWSPLLGCPGKRPTIGGVLASNLSGPRRLSAGAARDHFLGFRAVSGRGEVFKAGGRVVKNVTGYDLPKLVAGSWGTLAVLTEVTMRVQPAPELERTLLLPLEAPAEALRAMTAALASQAEVSAAAFVPASGLALRLEGFAPSVEARASVLDECLGGALGASGVSLDDSESRRLWRRVGAVEPLASSPVVWRLSTPPSEAASVLEQLAPERYLLDWGGGLLWIGAQEVQAQRIRGSLASGHATLVKAPREAREATAVFPPQPPALAAVMGRVKAAFDPEGRLNPGRMS